jgi:hypothetical protein
MKRFSVALALTILVSVSAFAGEIPTMGAPQPQSQQTTSPTLLGEIPSGGGSISDAAVSALLTALGLASV